jgi:hypothetical protein
MIDAVVMLLLSWSSGEQHPYQTPTGTEAVTVNKLEFYWWGVKLFVDEAKTQEIIMALQGGGAAVAVGGILSAFGAVPAAVISGLIWLDAFAIGIADANHRGVVFTCTWIGLPWCWSQ